MKLLPSRMMSWALPALALLASAASAQPRYLLTDLGQLPGTASCVANGLNDRGDVVGYCAPAVENFNQQGFVWRAGVLAATGLLPKGNYSVATAVNAAGTVVGDGDTGNFRPQGWVRQNGRLVNFFPNNGGNTHALFAADAGWIGGYYTKSLSGNTSSWRGAIWSPDPKDARKWRLTNLPVLPGGIDPASTASIPMGFSEAGWAAGYAMNDQIGQHAALWLNDAAHTVVDLGMWGDDGSSVAYAVNHLGQAVGSSHPPFGSRPVLWDRDAAHTAYALAVLPGDNQGRAFAIGGSGHVLGESWFGTPGSWDRTPGSLVLWRDGGVYRLQDLLDPVTAAGCTVNGAAAVNAAGQIAASAMCGGRQRAVLLSPL